MMKYQSSLPEHQDKGIDKKAKELYTFNAMGRLGEEIKEMMRSEMNED